MPHGISRLLFLALSLGTLCLSPSYAQQSDAPPAPITREVLQRDIDTGHADRALSQIAQLRSQPQPPIWLAHEEGLALYAKGDLRAADAAFAAAIKADPSDTEAAQMRGLTLFRLGRPGDAIPLLESSRNTTASKADPNYILSLCYMDLRRYDDARRALAAQYAFPPESAPAYLIAARMLLRREFLPVSQQFAQKALDIDSHLPLAHELLGEIALAQGRTDDAIHEFETERNHDPLDPAVYDRLGDAYIRQGRYDDATSSLQRAVLLEPNATGPYILLGKAMLKKNDAVGAITFLEHAREMDPANYITHSLLGQAYRTVGRTDEAKRETDLAQKIQAASEPKLDSIH